MTAIRQAAKGPVYIQHYDVTNEGVFDRERLFRVKLPRGAQVVKAALTLKGLRIFAIGDSGQPIEDRRFWSLRNGAMIPHDVAFDYLDTFATSTGVWHLFVEASYPS